jgi:hypothetical protein
LDKERQLNDQERIQNDDYLFGLGIGISEVLSDYLAEQKMEDDQVTSIVVNGEENTYDGILEEIRMICKNEGLDFVATKYFIPLDSECEHYSSYTNDEFILIKNIDPENDSEEQGEMLFNIVGQFKKLHDYFNLDGGAERISYFMYFPENILIDNEGRGLCEVVIESEWEHKEKYGEHED